MKNKIADYLKEVERFSAEKPEELDAFRIKFLSKKGLIPALFADFKNIPTEERKEIGQLINQLKLKTISTISQH